MRAKLSNLQSIPQVVAEMTLDEKLDMVGCYRACHTRPIPDMDVPAIYLMDGATGLNGTHVVLDYLTDPCRADDPRTAYATPEMVALNRVDLNEAAAKYKGDALMTDLVEQAVKYRPGGRQHISFPSGINIGASFDPISAETIGRAVGQELRDAGVDVCFGPNVDIARDPLGGRNYEMYGEDARIVAQKLDLTARTRSWWLRPRQPLYAVCRAPALRPVPSISSQTTRKRTATQQALTFQNGL